MAVAVRAEEGKKGGFFGALPALRAWCGAACAPPRCEPRQEIPCLRMQPGCAWHAADSTCSTPPVLRALTRAPSSPLRCAGFGGRKPSGTQKLGGAQAAPAEEKAGGLGTIFKRPGGTQKQGGTQAARRGGRGRDAGTGALGAGGAAGRWQGC